MILQLRRFSVALTGSALLFLMIGYPRTGSAATTWKVTAKMTLSQLQAKIDGASDGDTILFQKGSYDFSSAPSTLPTDYFGALNIIDKSLILEAEKGVIIKGRPSVLEGGVGTSGVVAFVFTNLLRDKDVVVRGFSFKTLMMAVSVWGCHNVIVEGCVLSQIDRNGIGTTGVGGNLSLLSNQISSRRSGFFVDWLFAPPGGPNSQTPGTDILISDNTVTRLGEWPYWMGIYIWGSRQGHIIRNTMASKANWGVWINSMPLPEEGEALPRLFISDNTVQGLPLGICIPDAAGVQISNNDISDITLAGVYLNGPNCKQNQVTDNRISVVGPLEWTESVYCYGIRTSAHDNLFLRNTVSGTGSVAFYVSSNGSNEVFECNSAKNFTPAPTAAHYVFSYGTYDNRFSETWDHGVFYLDLDGRNSVTTVLCK